MRFSISSLSLFAVSVLGMVTPPKNAITVGSSANAKFHTIQQAVTAAPSGSLIFIESGVYNEQVLIPVGKDNLTIIGQSSAIHDFKANTVKITHGIAQDSPGHPNNDKTGTLRVWGDGLKMYNVNLINTRGEGSQALALSAYGDRLGFYACQMRGFQDTVMSQKGRHFIGKSLIGGATDFIFGRRGLLWVEGSTIEVVGANIGYITANGRNMTSNPSYYVINNSEITGNSAPGTFYLGRPWRAFARVVFQNTVMSDIIYPQGWSTWQPNDTRTDTTSWGEYKNSGPGSVGPRLYGKALKAPVTITSVFGNAQWVDRAYF